MTGVLLFNQRDVLQCLEGSRKSVTDIFGAIAVDDRHTRVTEMSVHDIDERDFPDWSTGFVSATAALRATLLRFFPTEEFLPEALTGASATALMRCLR